MEPSFYEDKSSALVTHDAADFRGTPFPIILLEHEQFCRGECEVIEQIRRRNQGSRVVMLTSRGETGNGAACGSSHAACGSSHVDAIISKPFDEGCLQQVLRRLVDLAPGTRATHAQPAAAAPNGGPPVDEVAASLRILLVEDNAVNRKVAVAMLNKRGHHVTTASNGYEGLNAASREAFDVVLMDVQMPVMNGWEATAQIRIRERDSGAHLPIIAMTAHALKEDIEACRAAGMDGYVSKPFQIETLMEELGRVRKSVAVRTTAAYPQVAPGASTQLILDLWNAPPSSPLVP
jgi:CheY-like chemotaxis protein